jgi:hypothetical protein
MRKFKIRRGKMSNVMESKKGLEDLAEVDREVAGILKPYLKIRQSARAEILTKKLGFRLAFQILYIRDLARITLIGR